MDRDCRLLGLRCRTWVIIAYWLNIVPLLFVVVIGGHVLPSLALVGGGSLRRRAPMTPVWRLVSRYVAHFLDKALNMLFFWGLVYFSVALAVPPSAVARAPRAQILSGCEPPSTGPLILMALVPSPPHGVVLFLQLSCPSSIGLLIGVSWTSTAAFGDRDACGRYVVQTPLLRHLCSGGW